MKNSNKVKINLKDFPNEKNRLWSMCQVSIEMLEELMRQIEQHKLQDEQFVLDWLDKMNEISVKY